jgi:hypothetical protein
MLTKQSEVRTEPCELAFDIRTLKHHETSSAASRENVTEVNIPNPTMFFSQIKLEILSL